MRSFHRYLAVLALFLGLYVAGTGTFLQAIDLTTLIGHAPESDANLKAIREGGDGPPNFAVRVDADSDAKALPADFNFEAAATTVAAGARQATVRKVAHLYGAQQLLRGQLRAQKSHRVAAQAQAGGGVVKHHFFTLPGGW